MFMKKILLYSLIISISQTVFSQITFTDSSSNLSNSTLKSGVCIAVVDMNNDGLDDIVRKNSSSNLEIEYQSTSGTFTKLELGNIGSLWGFSIADVDQNGYNDIIGGGNYNAIKLFLANVDGTSYTVTNLGGPNIFVQNTNFADIDNDGDIDFFSCHDDGISSAYKNDGTGNFTYDLTLINAVSTVSSDNSGNYGSIWTDYDNDGDLDMYLSKCRLGVSDVNDGRRLNLLFQNDGSGNFTDVAGAAGLLPLSQTWATCFEDIDNDGDLDAFMINHDKDSQIYINNGDGTFTDITASSGIVTELQDAEFGIQVIMEDFDNDTFVDILMTSTFSSGNHYLFMNDGDNTFTPLASPFGSEIIQSAASGDLNNDGFIDILAGYADSFNTPSSNSDQLFLNDGNSNNWSEIILEGVNSNINGIGARVEIYGAWGKQIREVRAGESYGTQNSLITHFGIANATSIDKIIVRWPSGAADEIINPNINEKLSITEGDNVLSARNIVINTFGVYPTLAKDFINVNSNFNQEEITFSIFSITGKQVLSQRIKGLGETNINISNLKTGIYFLKVGNTNLKMVKI